MAFISIAGLPGAGPVPVALADRLSHASVVVVTSADSRAHGVLGAVGLHPLTFADLGLESEPSADRLASVLAEAAGDGEAVLVVDSPIPTLPLEPHPAFAELVRIMHVLRSPEGCPWDLEQTHATLRPNIIEEAYEVVQAIDDVDDVELAEELGDVLLQVAFHSQMASEAGTFTIDDVAAGIVAKLIRRHPHIFGDAEAGSADDTLHRWDQLKRIEKPERTGALEGIPSSLPSLAAAQKISRRVVAVGFEWEDTEGVFAKMDEEISELRATEKGSPEAAEEIGDLLFTVVNLARRYGVDAEIALRGMNEKFSRRWRSMESAAAADGNDLAELGTRELETLWEQAKREERATKERGAL